MAIGSSIDAKEQIRHAIDIVDLVGDYLPLRREGRIYKALCPWHADTRPSLQVNPERQSFKCWVCDIGGDIFSFVMKMDGVEFPEALALLAERAGVELGARGGSSGGSDQRKLWYQALAWAEELYHQALLHAPDAEPARRYLHDRQVAEANWRRWHLGYAPLTRNWLIHRARETPFTNQVLEAVGLLGRSTERDDNYERFRGRVLFSIRDVQGRPVGTGGRLLPGMEETSPAKYVNSPETPVFAKSELLYGLDQARDAISSTKTAIVTEGYTDCIMAHQHGYTNAVAVLGTALGPRHIKLLKRFADRVVLVLDGDEAGQRRTNEILELFVAEEVDLQILTLPDELDPCEFLLERGADAFREALGRTVDALDHRLALATSGLGSQPGTHEAHQAIEAVLSTLAKSRRLVGATGTAAQVKEDQILNQLARRFGASESTLRTRLATLRRGGSRPRTLQAQRPEGEPEPPLKLTTSETVLLEIMLQAPESLAEMRTVVTGDDLPTPAGRALWERVIELAEGGIVPTFERLLLEFDDPQLKSLLVSLDESGRAKHGAEIADVLGQLLNDYRRRAQARVVRSQVTALARGEVSAQDEEEVLARLIAGERSRRGISRPTDG